MDKRAREMGRVLCPLRVIPSEAVISRYYAHEKPGHITLSPRVGAMGAPPVAESSDLSEWLRSIADDGLSRPRKISGTATVVEGPPDYIRADSSREIPRLRFTPLGMTEKTGACLLTRPGGV